ncbi:hypothetical protein MMC31_007791, partial [Peltigera leucophlebia]|nr:hypothetical protein [Peltigera leucophlebia]
MAFNYGASDIVALFTLAHKLYSDVYVPAREAPKTRRELIKELAALKDVLSTLADDTKSKTFQQRLGESRKRTLNRCLLNCGETLSRLDKLVAKHRNPRGSLWGGIKWVGIKGEVAELKSKIAIYSAQLSLCLSSIGNSTLLRLENSLDTALTRIPEVPSDAEDEADVPNPLTQTLSEPKGKIDDRKSEVVPGLNGRRVTTGSHVANPGMNGFSESTPLLFEDDLSGSGICRAPMRNGEQVQVNGSIVPAHRMTPKQRLGSAEDGTYRSEESVAEIVAGVIRILREKETLHRPLKHDRARIKNHQPNKILAEKFEKHVSDELKRHRLSTFPTKKWLRISTWWLLKVPIHTVPLSLRAALIRKLRQSTPGRNTKDTSQQILPSVYPDTGNRRQTKL